MSIADRQEADCLGCRKHLGDSSIPGGAIYENDLVCAGHAQTRKGQATAYSGYLMAGPKRHAMVLADLTDTEVQAPGLLVALVCRVLRDRKGVEHVHAFVLGDPVAHVHIHVVPRYPGAPRDYGGVRVDQWTGAPHAGPQKIAALCEELRVGMGDERCPRV